MEGISHTQQQEIAPQEETKKSSPYIVRGVRGWSNRLIGAAVIGAAALGSAGEAEAGGKNEAFLTGVLVGVVNQKMGGNVIRQVQNQSGVGVIVDPAESMKAVQRKRLLESQTSIGSDPVIGQFFNQEKIIFRESPNGWELYHPDNPGGRYLLRTSVQQGSSEERFKYTNFYFSQNGGNTLKVRFQHVSVTSLQSSTQEMSMTYSPQTKSFQ